MYVIRKKNTEDEFLDIPITSYKKCELVPLKGITRPYSKKGSAKNSLHQAFKWKADHLHPLTENDFEVRKVELRLLS